MGQWAHARSRAHDVVFTIEMSWETTDVLAADTADVLAADTRDVLAADTTDVLAADTTDVLAADKHVASEILVNPIKTLIWHGRCQHFCQK